MTIHPITVVDRVTDEYADYLRTEFRARDPQLRAALEAALAEPLFLAQDPFFQAHRPFKDGEPWRELGLDAALARAMEEASDSKTAFLHQSDAIQHLLAADTGPLVVTTGTGSGKTECFLLPALQNAIEDAGRFKRNGLTAILVYPMNALANDQEERIRKLLSASGHTAVQIARYDRSTKEEDRERWRTSPPHLLLTNYVMLEYLLVRPADRDALFANHRCRFVVLDEVHTYRGSLGANIALLLRRLFAHLRRARQDWGAEDRTDRRRFPKPVAVATSATIKSIDETGRSADEVARLRDAAVQEFFGKLVGATPASIRVVGETLRDLKTPSGARWSDRPCDKGDVAAGDTEGVRRAAAALAGLPSSTAVEESGTSAAILWTLNEMLARRPMSIGDIASRILTDVPARAGADAAAVRREVERALAIGAALPDGCPGALRLRAHRFIRGGWRFHRCVDPACGRLYPMGEERCECGRLTAPLYLCRSCGVDALRFRSDAAAAELDLLTPHGERGAEGEWILYDRRRWDDVEGDEEGRDGPTQMKERPVLHGTFDPATCSFSAREDYPMAVVLAPARNRCLVCGSTAGGTGNVLTPVALGTSAAVRVLAEGLVEGLAKEHANDSAHDGKERLLIFADSRQDAAHQARFITYAGRYDRMRRQVIRVLESVGPSLALSEVVRALLARGVEARDNPSTAKYTDEAFLPEPVRRRGMAWEEAPLLDDLAVTAGYRATLPNLGLVGVRYEHLDAHVAKAGRDLASRLGVSEGQLAHLCRCLLDEMRTRSALTRLLLQVHPHSPNCPEEVRAADWERRISTPTGFPCAPDGHALPNIDRAELPDGVTSQNFWRRSKGRPPAAQRKLSNILRRMGGADLTEDLLLDIVDLLMGGPRLIVPVTLSGYRKTVTLLQVNGDAVRLELLRPDDRLRCSICNVRLPWATEGAPCPSCRGVLERWPDAEVQKSRYVQRILSGQIRPLVAAEHTAQVTGDERIELEARFKAKPEVSGLNVLSCSPTLEMGIDVGGLDAVVMRNVPPRPDNYAQRGGRAGRRSRVGIVLGYARSTPHDGYFFDKPAEMIAGEVPAPGVGLGNRDVVTRHLHAIAFGLTEPGLAGRMSEYVTLQGQEVEVAVQALIDGLALQTEPAVALARDAWGPEILEPAGFTTEQALRDELAKLPARIRDLIARVRRQVLELDQTIARWRELGRGDREAMNAQDLKRRLLGIRSDRDDDDADDRTSGHPMRRFAEFGILPGYEFPSEPCTVRLLGDAHEEDPISVQRRFGIAQYQPDAIAHARGHRWRVIGLDTSSPWNPKTDQPSWIYSICRGCGLRYGAQEHVRCPRCSSGETDAVGLPSHDLGGFIAKRDDAPVLEEEDRFAIASLVQIHPQWDGEVVRRARLATGWTAELARGEAIRWVNEWKPPSAADVDEDRPKLHARARGFYLCLTCGRVLEAPSGTPKPAKGRKKATKGTTPDPFNHSSGCMRAGQPPVPIAIGTRSGATTLRMLVHLPAGLEKGEFLRWGYSLGYALRIGMRHLYVLDGPEVEFALEGPWETRVRDIPLLGGALTFIDAAVGGSGFLDRTANDLHLVAARALEHLDHRGCETACYRCLKSYTNQRYHEFLEWPRIIGDLAQLASEAPKAMPGKRGDLDDPGPWLAAYDAGVGSPLELEFLRLFEKHGLAVEKQVPVAASAGEPVISTADFVIAGSRVAIYVDGAAFHQGERLRRDRFIRDRLRSGDRQWTVVEVAASDLRRGLGLVEELRKISTKPPAAGTSS